MATRSQPLHLLDASERTALAATFCREKQTLPTSFDAKADLLDATHLRVFSQRPLAVYEDHWRDQARVFFQANLGLATPFDGKGPWTSLAFWLHITYIMQSDATASAPIPVLLYGRQARASDLDDARECQAAQGIFGMAELAARCQYVWLVATPTEPDLALTIAAILASCELGPILNEGEIFGVKTARAKVLSTRR
jgi:hypothetical protein